MNIFMDNIVSSPILFIRFMCGCACLGIACLYVAYCWATVKCPICSKRHDPIHNDLINDPCDKCRIMYAESFKVKLGA